MEKTNNLRNDRYNHVRAFACIAIIGIHTVYASIVLFPDSASENCMLICHTILNCLMWAVPCFLMVTGALLLDRNRSLTYKKLFGKYIGRVLLAIVFWGMMYIIYEMTVEQKPVGIRVFLNDLYEIFAGTSWSHMWYLYCLLGLYLLLPFYKKAAEASTDNDLRYLLAVYLCFLSLLPILHIWDIKCGFYIHTATIYPFWLFCGYGMKEGILRKKAEIYWALFIAGTLALVLLSCLRWKNHIDSLEVFFSYSSVFVVMQAVGIFGIFLYTNWKGLGWLNRILQDIDEYSFGVYLVHMLFVRAILKEIGFNPFEYNIGWSLPCLILIIFLLSYIVVWIMKKIPFLRRTV